MVILICTKKSKPQKQFKEALQKVGSNLRTSTHESFLFHVP